MSNNRTYITIREATDHDAGALERLAQLDSDRVPARPLLVAEVSGELAAAMSTADGTTIADPFRPTAGAVAALRLQAGFAPRPDGALQRLWGGFARPDEPRPSSPSVPGFPVVPGHTL